MPHHSLERSHRQRGRRGLELLQVGVLTSCRDDKRSVTGVGFLRRPAQGSTCEMPHPEA